MRWKSIIDTGIDVDHPDLVDNIKGGYNATGKKKSYDDDNGHETHVAGIIAAVDNDIDIINMSIGMENESTLLQESIVKAYKGCSSREQLWGRLRISSNV